MVNTAFQKLAGSKLSLSDLYVAFYITSEFKKTFVGYSYHHTKQIN